MRWNNYHYYHPIHFVFTEFRGTKDQCMAAFNKQREQYPQNLFATTIASSDLSDENNSYVLIRRFVSEETCRTHLKFPPTYVREGRSIE